MSGLRVSSPPFMRPIFPTVSFLVALLVQSCAQPAGEHTTALRTGPWRMELDLNGQALPFLFDLSLQDHSWTALIHNGEEKITVTDIVQHGDSFTMRMPLYDSEFKGMIRSDSVVTGHWYNYLKGPDYRIPFRARAGAAERFDHDRAAEGTIDGKWEVHFSPGTPDSYDALGLFHQRGAIVTGTFGTETGDYRFLEGALMGDSLFLSCFDGSHAFLFKARMFGDSLTGRYWSGIHWQEPWRAVRNEHFALRDPDSLTFLREGYEMVDFTFPDLDGDPISPLDSAHAGKVLMVQIMGSWCPNCVDETLLLDEMYARYHDQGLGVIAVAFEKNEDPVRAVEQLRTFKDRLNIKYDVVYAGRASKEEASRKLPFLDHVMSYPTCIFIDRSGRVRRIRTGFYGPGTGEHYVNYKRNLENFLVQLLDERREG